MGRKELGLLFPPFNLNKGAESLRIVYYMGKRNSYSFPTFIKGLMEVETTLEVFRGSCQVNIHFLKPSKIL